MRQRALECREYCGSEQRNEAWSLFHVEHVLPIKHGGTDTWENLALACQHCNLHKGTNLSGIDPACGEMIRLFNPRLDDWSFHFTLVGTEIIGRTEIGRTTVVVLNMNARSRRDLRERPED